MGQGCALGPETAVEVANLSCSRGCPEAAILPRISLCSATKEPRVQGVPAGHGHLYHFP